MPWRGPQYQGEFPSGGWAALRWIEEHLIVPDGTEAGQPLIATTEQAAFTIRLFRLEPRRGRTYVYRLGQMMWPQGMGKSPWMAALAWYAAKGLIVPTGWDAAGNPVGRPHPSPWIQIAANAEDQTQNTWRSLLPMASPDEGATLLSVYPDIDLGETRVFVGGGGKLETVTSRAGTRNGQRVTFAVEEETQFWFPHTGGLRLDQTLRRNVGKMNGLVVEGCNAPQPGAGSVAERHQRSAETTPDLLVDRRQAPKIDNIHDKRALKKALREVYGSSATRNRIVNVDRLVAEFQETGADIIDLRRFYLNDTDTVPEEQYITEIEWDATVAHPVVPPGGLITLGFDGARYFDSTALVATHVETAHQWTVGLWERPIVEGTPLDGWEVDTNNVEDTLVEVFDTYQVWRLYADPPYWEDRVKGTWPAKFGKERVISWDTYRERATAFALRSYSQAVRAEEMTHTDDPAAKRHILNAVKVPTRRTKDDEGRPLYVIRKREPALKIDWTMAAVLSKEAQRDAIAAGALRKKRYRAAGF